MKWEWKAIVVARIDFPPGGQPSELYKLLNEQKSRGWDQVGYDPWEDVFIFRRPMSNERKEAEDKKHKAITEMIRR
jgi:hypothetical protein